MKLKMWIFIETAKDGNYSYYSSGSKTRKECRSHYKRLCAMKNGGFGKPGETVQYVKLTGEMK